MLYKLQGKVRLHIIQLKGFELILVSKFKRNYLLLGN